MRGLVAVATEYTEEFYNTITDGSERSALAMADSIRGWTLDFTSLIDVGCGKGVWGKTFKDKYDCEVLGVDGVYVTDPVIPFMAHDLTQPLILDKTYDIALCLEVAEHLPEESADTLVDSLVNASDTIIFSAAIPFQTGAGHINCQWQSYWAEKFQERGYDCDDVLRHMFWNDKRVEPWYKQNMLIYYKNDGDRIMLPSMIDVVHPEIHYWGRV